MQATGVDAAGASLLDDILRSTAAAGASDTHFSADAPALQRLDGDLAAVAGYPDAIPAAVLLDELLATMGPSHREDYRATGEVDLSYTVPGVGRFRVNVFRQLGQVAAAFRLIASRAFSLDELGAPAVARDLALRPRGLVLVTGPTGSGKSTTLTAMIDVINSTKPDHIVTVEDPIEFVHTSRRSLVHQREVGSDTRSFAEALRRVLRQDPDVILIGELRDPESISTALTAAETGHLVLSTLHTQGAAKSINRIVDAFPAHQQNQVRSQLGDTLQGVISQTLLPKAQGGGRVIATEVLVSTPAVANLIRENQISQLYNAMQAGEGHGMHTLDQSLKRLVEEGEVAASVARHYLTDAHALDDVRVRPRDYDAEAWLAAASPGAARPAEDDWGM
ncbi:type IV pilus twitching motility protein PilT [Microbacterium sp. EYE_5]|nr:MULTISPECIES: type IV pilus twitching motility protein PilT [unclassified Microbacterium]MCK6079380.1 type IV pilus twitching motility protein PilT [Microbacterium sp. EYE_382]MCK6123121.1 type IV pilus twitching motility protein PilT [Microbacterium sp. EYE_80]MCK6125414.1 type IV pilus twitching motility protein PilT [Microbacterium sp. EYE_79]MCK6217061.1 type IV pilus twitching motility protein PilT [Microbacterium sp. EYE_5]MCK6227452.1 type IV pilus twitching motility protein PilT [Mi